MATLAVIGWTVRGRWRQALALWSVLFVAYQLFLLAPFVAFGAPPNYLKVYDAWGGIIETLQLSPPPGVLWELLVDQPVWELGIRDRNLWLLQQLVADEIKRLHATSLAAREPSRAP